MNHLEIARQLESHRVEIVDTVVAVTMQNPFWIDRYGERVASKIAFDTEHNLASVIKAIRYRSPMILDDYILWLRSTLLENRCSTGMVREAFLYLWNALSRHVPAAAQPTVYQTIQNAIQKLDYDKPSARQIAQHHEALAEALVVRCYDSNWHWQTAYGTEERTRASYEFWMCLDYLIDSLGMNNERFVVTHILWMRDHNLQRGLSTMHMQQLLWTLAGIIQEQIEPGPASDARRLLETCSASLLHDSEAYRSLLASQDMIVGEVAQQLVAQGLAAQPEQSAIEVGWYLAYLGDSLARKDSANLVGYTRWMQHWYASYGVPPTTLQHSYSVMSDALQRHLPQYAARDACSILQAAQNAL